MCFIQIHIKNRFDIFARILERDRMLATFATRRMAQELPMLSITKEFMDRSQRAQQNVNQSSYNYFLSYFFSIDIQLLFFKHRNRYNNVVVYRCDFCHKGFRRILAYEKHRATHTGITGNYLTVNAIQCIDIYFELFSCCPMLSRWVPIHLFRNVTTEGKDYSRLQIIQFCLCLRTFSIQLFIVIGSHGWESPY